ncbi:NUDIX hydrolase [Chelatococcus daeguensis]|nr:NUDIX hydrolase [Chelatococcus daeguensis]
MRTVTNRKCLRIAVAAVRDEKGRLLLVSKHGSDIFIQPGGKIEPGEAPEAALARELAEELSVAPQPGTLHSLGVFTAPAANEPDTDVIAHLFAVHLAGTPRAAAEIAELSWLPLHEADRWPLASLIRDKVLPLLAKTIPAQDLGIVR